MAVMIVQAAVLVCRCAGFKSGSCHWLNLCFVVQNSALML